MRSVEYVYRDPIEVVWLRTAAEFGMRVERSSAVNAAWDGNGTLLIGTPETLDADDCPAQMIFHEICHFLTEGPDSFFLPDWGLQMDRGGQRVREFACLRLQASLADEFGLRRLLASTTVFRRYYDRLPDDPLADCDDPAAKPARIGRQRAETEPTRTHLRRALQATADIAAVIRPYADSDSLWRLAEESHSAVR